MRVINNNNVTKYIHKDGSETVIKCTPSMEYLSGHKVDNFQIVSHDRNKYSILISSSVGCQMGCKMCGIDPKTYKHLNSDQIIQNVKDAVTHHDFYIGHLGDKYVKLCFMGMGESILENTNFNKVPGKLLRFLTNKGYAKGVDSVDYGTMLPKNRDKMWVERVITLNKFIKSQYPINPANNHKSLVRVFYSLHQLDKEKRRDLIPMGAHNTSDLLDVVNAGIELVMHYTLIDGVNDTSTDINNLWWHFSRRTDVQLRLLRYNTNGKYQESRYMGLAWKVLSNLPNVKFQVSPGKEVNSACGQFG